MKRIYPGFALALLVCAAASAATVNTTLTVTNATLSIGASTSLTGPATLTTIGNGTFSAPSLAADSSGNYSGAYTITLTGGVDKISGVLKIPTAAIAAALSGGAITGSATVTGGAGAYAGATGNFASLSGTGALVGTSISVTFSGAGTITTGGTGGGGGTPTPTIDTVQNNYGQISPGLPNYGLAPSAIFYIKGSNLANSSTGLQSSADPGLKTTLNGVTVTVKSGSTSLDCPIYYVLPTQVAAILPGTTPLGNATITVNNNGTPSSTFPIVVVQSAFGILGYNGTLAAAYDANNAIVTSTNSANPGQAIILWGSGVGNDPASDDKLYPQKQNNLTNIPIQAFVGGATATIAYRGRSQFPGLDQVVLTIPNNAPTGCFVSLTIVSGNIVSNSVTLPIAASGKTCSDTNTGITPDIFNGLAGKSTVKVGVLTVSQSTSISSAGTATEGGVGGFFQTLSGFATSQEGAQVSLGSCIVPPVDTTASPTTNTPLDAGASIAVTGPGGSLTLTPLSGPVSLPGFYFPPSGVTPAGFIPSTGGTYTFDNGSGGKDVQHFNASIALPPAFTWTNAASVSAVGRSQGVNVTWSGGAPGSYVSITGASTSTINGKIISVGFTCEAPVEAGQFTVPAGVLLALPAGNGELSLGDYTNLKLFTAAGLDLGMLTGGNTVSKTLNYN